MGVLLVDGDGGSVGLANFLEAQRSEMLDAFGRALETSGTVLAQSPSALRLARTSAGQMLDDALATLRAGEVRVDESYKLLASEIGATRAAEGIHPHESMQAASIWFRTAIAATLPYLTAQPESLEILVLFALGLERSITTRIRESSASYTGFLLNKVHEVQVKERQRIARELHDHIGHGLSVTHRQLELYDLRRTTDQGKAAANLETAIQTVQETMQNLRSVTWGLHLQEPLKSLEKALLCHLETIDVEGVTINLRVNGDETWAVPSVRDESFMIIREANASQVLIRVDIAPHELRATIEDDGCGFVPDGGYPSSSVGLASMRERAELMGGTATVTSRLDAGTLVELSVPF
jgi:signal transduction histidine kinase